MPNIKRYEIEYDWKGSLTVEIDHEVMTDEKLHEINDFWSSNTYRISKQGSVLNAVLAMLAQQAFLIQISNDYNTYGVVSAFSWTDGEGQEGWPPMDGSEGIKIIDSQIDLFDTDDMTITAAK
ncbi:DUF2528 domain-containing protein [Serratia liquefaciens]|uniref:DUF2528 family protein n=1 Tax=Serratia liquefaciens TaxID=614 RepID=UPI00076B7056|nr:DUF2528 family protein [Serratia liquefaciens]AMH01850.1 DUF2528 domain-containing protein [Serratia liquefaciens]